MLTVLKEYVENDYIITEYTRDGETVAAVVKTAVSENLEGEVITLPKNPIQVLQEENGKLQQQQAQLNADLEAFMEFYFSGGME
jgi:hypothetical protein